MRQPGHPTRTTLLVAAALALLLLGAYAATARWRTDAPPAPPAPAAPTPLPGSASPTRPAAVPRPARGTPVRRLGSLSDRSVLASGHGTVVLRYARAPHNATRVHFICQGCDAGTWLVELPRETPVAADGPLPDPAYATGVTDVDDAAARTDLLVVAPEGADWSVTLTPFDEIPVHREGFDALDADVVAVRTAGDLTLTCGGAYAYRSFARPAPGTEYAAVAAGSHGGAGVVTLRPGRGSDVLVLVVSCPGRWTVAVA